MELLPTIEGCVSELEARLIESDLTVKIQEPELAVFGSFDPDRLAQVVLNLLSKAIKFSPKGAKQNRRWWYRARFGHL